MADVSLPELGYGPCPECGEDMTADDELHTRHDGADIHAECCTACEYDLAYCPGCSSPYPAGCPTHLLRLVTMNDEPTNDEHISDIERAALADPKFHEALAQARSGDVVKRPRPKRP